MPSRTSKKKTRHGDAQNEEDSPRSSSPRLDIEKNSLTEHQVDEISFRIENELTRKMRDEIKKSENHIRKALNSLSENSLNDGYTSPSAETAPCGKNAISVQRASHELDSDQETIDPNESFVGAQTQSHDKMTSFWIS